MTLGKKLQALRKERHISQEYLAEEINVSRQAISKWERDLATPDTDNILQLSKFFEVPVEYLLHESYECANKSEPPEKTKTKLFGSHRYCIIGGITLMILSVCGACISKLYDKIINGYYYTNAMDYLKEFPLLYLFLLGIVLFLIGIIKRKK